MSQNRPISAFIEKNYLHFNSAALVDAAKAYKTHIADGKKMLVSLAGAMSTAELGISFAEMIRKNKVHIISCTGANLEEDIMNLVAHSHYKGSLITVTLLPNRSGPAPEPFEPCNGYLYPRGRKLSAVYKNTCLKYGKMPRTKVNVFSRMSSCSA